MCMSSGISLLKASNWPGGTSRFVLIHTPKAQGLCRTQLWTLMIPTNISNLGCSPVEFHQLLWSDEKPWKDLPLSLAR